MTRPEKRRRGAKKQQRMLDLGTILTCGTESTPSRWDITRHWSDATNMYEFIMSRSWWSEKNQEGR